ncbi:MAG: hypothetical protein ACR2PR_03140 [Pseudohongiellaceae bacterium]
MPNYLDSINLDMPKVKRHYLMRANISSQLKELLIEDKKEDFAKIAVGHTNRAGNYSASKRALSELILEQPGSYSSIVRLANEFNGGQLRVNDIPNTIRKADISYLDISVGSEIACLLRPDKFWVGNVRTIWPHLLLENEWDRDQADNAEACYKEWPAIYPTMESSLDSIEELAEGWATNQDVTPGPLKYLWIDAVCSELYELYARKEDDNK